MIGGPAQKLGGVITQVILECGTEVGVAAARINFPDAIGGVLDQRPVLLLADPQGCLGGLAGGDIGGNAAQRIDLAGGVTQRNLHRLISLDDSAIGAGHHFFGGDPFAGFQHPAVVMVHPAGGIQVEQIGVGVTDDVLQIFAEQGAGGLIGVGIAVARILDVDIGLDAVQDGDEAFLAVAQLRLDALLLGDFFLQLVPGGAVVVFHAPGVQADQDQGDQLHRQNMNQDVITLHAGFEHGR